MPEQKYAPQKMDQLQRTSDTIRLVSPFMVTFILVMCCRIVYDALSRFYGAVDKPPAIIYSFDFSIAIDLLMTFVGLAIAHFTTRWSDDKIQKMIRADEAAAKKAATKATRA